MKHITDYRGAFVPSKAAAPKRKAHPEPLEPTREPDEINAEERAEAHEIRHAKPHGAHAVLPVVHDRQRKRSSVVARPALAPVAGQKGFELVGASVEMLAVGKLCGMPENPAHFRFGYRTDCPVLAAYAAVRSPVERRIVLEERVARGQQIQPEIHDFAALPALPENVERQELRRHDRRKWFLKKPLTKPPVRNRLAVDGKSFLLRVQAAVEGFFPKMRILSVAAAFAVDLPHFGEKCRVFFLVVVPHGFVRITIKMFGLYTASFILEEFGGRDVGLFLRVSYLDAKEIFQSVG